MASGATPPPFGGLLAAPRRGAVAEVGVPDALVDGDRVFVPPGGTVAFRVVVTDMTPQPVFYLFQKRNPPVAEDARERPQLVEERAD